MNNSQQARVEYWIEDVSQGLHATPPGAGQLAGGLTSPSTPKERHKREWTDLDITDLMSESDPRKRLTRADSEATTSVSRFHDDITLTPSTAPSGSATSRSGRSRSSSPSRIKAELARATPKVTFVHES